MFRLFALLLLSSFLTTFAINARVDIPYVFIKNYSLVDYNASSQNWDLTISPKGVLYVANNSGLLSFDGNNWNLYELPDKSALQKVTIVNDTLYSKSEASTGYWLTDGKGYMHYYPVDNLDRYIQFRNSTKSVIAAGLTFTGTSADGIYISNPEGTKFLHLTTDEGLQDNIIQNLIVENQGKVWAVFDNGLAAITINPALSLLAKRSNVGKLLDAVLIDQTIFIKTNTGYYKSEIFDNRILIPIPKEEAFSYFSKNTDNEKLNWGHIITDTNKYNQFDKSQRIHWISDTVFWLTKKNEAKLINVKEDSISLKCRIMFDNYHMNLISRGKQIMALNDSLYIASTVQGILLINVNRLIRSGSDNGLPLHFTRIEYQDKKGVHSFDLHTEEISLPFNFQQAIINVGSSVFNPNNQISYQIENISPDWSDWQRDGKITFLQLPEGNYKLRIRKYVPVGPFPELNLIIKIYPPWYKTIYAYISYMILMVIMILGIFYSFRKKHMIKEKYRMQEEQQKIQQLKNEMLEKELQNKKNELMIQASALAHRGIAMNTLSVELERQKKILGDRYPDNFFHRMQSLLNETLNNQAEWIAFRTYFNSSHQDFTERFRNQYPNITHNDIRICCLLRMNLSTKEIASLLNISVRAVELRRYRLRRRIGLESDKNLVDFLMNF